MSALSTVANIFDRIEHFWDSPRVRRIVGSGVVVSFVLSLSVVQLARWGLIPWGDKPPSHFYALEMAFTILLVVEVIDLIFAFADSIASAAGRQFQVLSLILLRQTFKELKGFQEPLIWEEVREVLPWIVSDALGALLIFIVLGQFYRMQRHQRELKNEDDHQTFIELKKVIALGLLFGAIGTGAVNLAAEFGYGEHQPFFEGLYTAMIFIDVLIVLISIRFASAYRVLFRYFGFAAATLMLRLALSAPRMVDAALGVGAILFCVALTWAYHFTEPALPEKEPKFPHKEPTPPDAVAPLPAPEPVLTPTA
ncbi:MAG: hypothetical protein AAFV53_20715 [Myxococcota bacterium]